MTAPVRSRPIAERILDSFPAGSYALHALLRVLDIVESDEVETAATECRVQPKLLINPRFVEQHAATPEKLLMLVMHELHHVLLGHTRLFPRVTRVDNLVFDAVINALLCRMLPAPEHTRFFTDYYSDATFPACLLRPPQDWTPGATIVACPPALAPASMAAARHVYEQLYSDCGASYHDLYGLLAGYVSEQQALAVPLLGGHEHDEHNIDGVNLRAGSPVLFDAVRKIVEEWPQPPDPIAGRSLEELTRGEFAQPSRSRSNRQALRALLRRVAGIDGYGSNRQAMADPLGVATPIPAFDRRSLVLGTLGIRPLLHRSPVPATRVLPAGDRVHVYVDVSGSIGDLKGALYGAVLDSRTFVHPTVHLFSTVIADVSMAQLGRGACTTTGGTDIACVASHMSEQRIRRAVIITDGFVGKPRGEHADVLHRATLGIALTPGASTRDDLSGVADYWTQLGERTGKDG